MIYTKHNTHPLAPPCSVLHIVHSVPLATYTTTPLTIKRRHRRGGAWSEKAGAEFLIDCRGWVWLTMRWRSHHHHHHRHLTEAGTIPHKAGIHDFFIRGRIVWKNALPLVVRSITTYHSPIGVGMTSCDSRRASDVSRIRICIRRRAVRVVSKTTRKLIRYRRG